MKTIILMRHSQADKKSMLPNARIPLTEEGISRALRLFERDEFKGVESVCASSYRRAYETAKLLWPVVLIDQRLIERRLGDPKTLDAAFWEKQYLDGDYKNRNGESLNEAGRRIGEFVDEQLCGMSDGEKVLIVSHAAAICGFLMRYCEVSVTDAEQKMRRITFGGETVLDGKIETPSAFVLRFDEDRIQSVAYIE